MGCKWTQTSDVAIGIKCQSIIHFTDNWNYKSLDMVPGVTTKIQNIGKSPITSYSEFLFSNQISGSN